MFNATISSAFIPGPPRSFSLHTEAAGSAPPDAFGPFRVLHQIGAGTLGPVFRAYDPEQDKLVAVKLFRVDLTPERVHAFVAELERLIAADLTHSAIVAPIGTGMVQASAYLAQDFVAAESLDTVVREHGPAPAGEALRIVTQIAGALDFAAVVGVRHGALHPRDVLISPDDVRVTGLGVAAALEQAGGQVPVRRPYSAPERVAGQVWDRRADVFSLATLAHELLWGRRITAVGADAAAGLVEVPGARLDRLRVAFAHALAEQPTNRYATALEFAAALKDAFSGKPVVEDRRPAAAAAPMLPLAADEPDETPAPAPSLAPPPRPRELTVAEAIALEESGGDEAIDDLLIRRAEADRFNDVETAPAIVPPDIDMQDDTIRALRVESTEPVDVQVTDRPTRSPGVRAKPFERTADVQPMSPADTSAPATAAVRPDYPEQPILREHRPQPERAAPPADPDERLHPANALYAAHAVHPAPDYRSAIWPLSLALILGIAMGFAGGYWLGQSERERSQMAAATAATSDTEVRLKPDTTTAREEGAATAGDARTLPTVTPPAAVPPAVEPATASPPAAAPPARSPEPVAPAVARTGRITVRTTPGGARVVIDGRDVGKTPLTIPNLARGSHTVRVMRDGYVTQERRVTITASDPTSTLALNLPRTPVPASTSARAAAPPPRAAAPPQRAARDTAVLLVESRPTGATVFIDGKRVGTTPMELPTVTAGAHAVRLEMAGYRTWTSSVRVVAGERNRVAASLEQ